MKSGLRIGITFFWGPSYKHIWSNGAGQNMYFLRETLMQIPEVDDVYFVFWGNDLKTLPKELEVDAMRIAVYPYEEVVETTDVLIEGTLTLEPFYEKEFRKHGAKIVTYRMGNDFIWDMEKFIVGKDGGRAFNGSTYDQVWLIPQVYETNKDYLSIMTGTTVYEVPHIWNSFFFDRQVAQLQEGLTFGYNPDKTKRGRRVSVFEPNSSVVKNCYIPVLIAEAVYKQDKEALAHVYLCNTYHLKDVSGFHNFIGYTRLVKDNVMTVESRHLMPYFLSRYTDIVLSYQWQLGLNYAYYEALYGNYPLVHNSELLRDAGVGFYYSGFDAYKGAEVLLDVINHYDASFETHATKNKAFLETLSPYNADVVASHRSLLQKLFED
ncbi:DUF2827 family protein [Veillonella criceti]|uniref:Protein of uncharacterized function (DUF2827) n=1 Tax=Veillonella criceti TaxID=103891 RepID=A0A380NLX0_9FIRM|nr:DUF2827 family protein [Veillonella criceti]SUP43593.1 Protein of uncharacterised function (DUF2827) [Veillonella criceti]